MIQCQNCGQSNSDQSQFCRFCGTKFLVAPPFVENNYEYEAPRPYSWKTDEFQTQSEPRKSKPINRPEELNTAQSVGNQNYAAQPLAYRGPYQMGPPLECPNCRNRFAVPRLERRISTAGWITFSVLLVFFFPLFWIGLLIKEDVRTCPGCGTKLM